MILHPLKIRSEIILNLKNNEFLFYKHLIFLVCHLSLSFNLSSAITTFCYAYSLFAMQTLCNANTFFAMHKHSLQCKHILCNANTLFAMQTLCNANSLQCKLFAMQTLCNANSLQCKLFAMKTLCNENSLQ